MIGVLIAIILGALAAYAVQTFVADEAMRKIFYFIIIVVVVLMLVAALTGYVNLDLRSPFVGD